MIQLTVSASQGESMVAGQRTSIVWWAGRYTVSMALAILVITLLSGCRPGAIRRYLITPTPVPISQLQPELVLEPARGEAGAPIQAVGTGWAPGETVALRLTDGSQRSPVLATGEVDQSGRFVATLGLPLAEPWSRPGIYTVVAEASNASQRSSADFMVAPPGTETPTPTLTPFFTSTPLPTFTPSATATPSTTPTGTATPTATALATASTTSSSFITGTLAHDGAIIETSGESWRGDYWRNPALFGPPAFVRQDDKIDFDWGESGPAADAGELGTDNFGVRWVRTVDLAPGPYRFILEVSGGARFFIDQQMVIDAWSEGGLRTLSIERDLTGGAHRLRLDYSNHSGPARIRLLWAPIPAAELWQGAYFANPALQGVPSEERLAAAIDFVWGQGSPAPSLPADGFSVRWVRTIAFVAGRYRFSLTADDGARVWMDGNLVIDQWQPNVPQPYVTEIYLIDQEYEVRVEYHDQAGPAAIQFAWQPVE
jgi:hypothetical protein